MDHEVPICTQTADSYRLPLPLTIKFQADRQIAEVIGFHSQGRVSAKDY